VSAEVTIPRRITLELLADVPEQWRGVVSATEPGVVAGTGLLDPSAAPDPAGRWTVLCSDGDRVQPGQPLVEVAGTAWELAVAEDHVLGVLGYAGGIAKRALELTSRAPAGLRLACGGWKKLPFAMKPVLRAGLDTAGVSHRLLDDDFVYVGKNTVILRGGVAEAVEAAATLGHGVVAVQVVDAREALAAAAAGCGVVMVDTGRLADLEQVRDVLRANGHDDVLLAFGGGVTAADLHAAAAAGAAIVDIGRAVIDAPLWDLHLVVAS
jgi:nicotinate-nucleotide pyrophosphorylase (carboxylating)